MPRHEVHSKPNSIETHSRHTSPKLLSRETPTDDALALCQNKSAHNTKGNLETDLASNKATAKDLPECGEIFRMKKPSHIGTGLGHGAVNVVKGLGLAATSLVAAPIAGACTGGASGFAKGVGIGVAGAIVFPVVGVATGVQQVWYGAKNTPDACRHAGDGKKYDSSKEEWVDKYRMLDEEFAECQAAFAQYSKEKENSSPEGCRRPTSPNDSSPTKVADREFYDVLGVEPDASIADIRKAYYKLARDCHPDKNKDDPQATAKFQRIGQAYQMLGDEERRRQYDLHGSQAADQMEFMDSGMFFGMLFGSDALEPFTGKLLLASMFENGESAEADALLKGAKDPRPQQYREIYLAVKLRDRLEPGVEALQKGPVAQRDWETEVRKVADKLCEASFGANLLDTIGFAYVNYSQLFQGKRKFLNYSGTAAKFSHKKRQAAIYLNALTSIQKASRASKMSQKRLNKKDGSSNGSNSQVEPPLTQEEVEGLDKGLKHVLDVMLQLCSADILETIRNACRKYLNDRSVTQDIQEVRAEALKIMGNIFMDAAKDYSAAHGIEDPREQMHAALIKMAEKMDQANENETPSAETTGTMP